jgi:trehalose 6-phosphate phosphatase
MKRRNHQACSLDTMLAPIPPISSLPISDLHPARIAIFLDFDGTLAPIVEHPDAVSVPGSTHNALSQLAEQTGALAIVTGRSIADIDRFLAPLVLPVAGVHGLERRSADGTIHGSPINQHALAEVSERLRNFVALHSGLLLEPKRGSIALHFRKRPDLTEACAIEVAEATAPFPDLSILPGKMVLEIKAGSASKANAITAFMAEEPFIGRQPLFVGDDVTDERAFPVVEQMHGITVKIGDTETTAAFRCEGPSAFTKWLGGLAIHFSALTYRN